MRRRRKHILTHRHSSDPGDFLRYFFGRENASMRGLGSLRELELDHLHLGTAGVLLEQLGREITLGVAAAEVSGSNLPDEVPPRLKMVRSQSSLSRVVGEPSVFGPSVESKDCVLAE